MITIRIGYCPPSPGPNSCYNGPWFTDKQDAINYLREHPRYVKDIWVSKSIGKKFRHISYEELYDL